MYWLGRIARRDPKLFVLWEQGVRPEARERRRLGKRPLSDPNGAAPLRRADKGNRAAVVEIKADRYTVDVLPIV